MGIDSCEDNDVQYMEAVTNQGEKKTLWQVQRGEAWLLQLDGKSKEHLILLIIATDLGFWFS